MKNIALLLFSTAVCIFILTARSIYSDSDQSVESVEKDITKYINLRQIAEDGGFNNYRRCIFVDDNTGVLYIEDENLGLTPIYNADGSLKNISDCE